mgnify:CR=1 FL=1
MNVHAASRTTAPSAQSANVDAGELEKFAALAHHWWDPESAMFGPLHRMNPLRLGWIERVSGGLAGKDVVDVGCGGGILTESMALRGARDPGKEVADYYARLVSWYVNGGFTDELGKRHESGHRYKIDYWEVLNEPDLEHNLTPEQYTVLYDAVVAAVKKVSPGTKFVATLR